MTEATFFVVVALGVLLVAGTHSIVHMLRSKADREQEMACACAQAAQALDRQYNQCDAGEYTGKPTED